MLWTRPTPTELTLMMPASNIARGLLLALLAALLGVMLGACRSSQPEETTTTIRQVDYVSEPLAEVVGRINVPEDTENWGILVFAEGTSHMATTDRRGEFRLSG